MAALVKACLAPDYPGQIVLVISNNSNAAGLAFASSKGIATLAIDHRPFGKDRAAFDQAIDNALREALVDYVCLAGFMRILTAAFVASWQGCIINIHPSLLPLYPGLHTHQRALEAGDKHHGCTVHFVTEGIDAGPIIAQTSIDILPSDTPESLADRVLIAEHKLYPEALARVLSGKVVFPAI